MEERKLVLKEMETLRNKVFKQFIKETSRSCAIVGCAYIDNALNELLKATLIKDNRIFLNYIDRSTCERRIILCYLLGLIGKQARDDLKRINKIRGWFAHEINLNSFNRENIKAECDKLKCLLNKQINGIEYKTYRRKYLLAISFYMGYLERALKDCRRINRNTLFK